MDVSENIRKCVGFILIEQFKPDMKTKYYQSIGTVFFVTKPIGEGRSRAFMITARHVIENAAKKGIKAFHIRSWGKSQSTIRVNDQLVTAPFHMTSKLENWKFHHDETVDAAYCSVHASLRSPSTIGTEQFATQEDIDNGYVQLGNDIIITGLFSYHQGDNTLEPIVRVGNIAMLPRDKILTRGFGKMEAYIIEARSIGGLSGSPVFLHQHRIWTDNNTQPDFEELNQKINEGSIAPSLQWGSRFRFLGLIHGHWDEEITADNLVEDVSGGQINVGAAVVVPAKNIFAMIDSAQVREKDAAMLAEFKQRELTKQ